MRIIKGNCGVSILDSIDHTRKMKLDSLSLSLVALNLSHHEIHAGASFMVVVDDDSMAGADTLVMAFKTGAATKRAHATISFNTLAACHLDILEGATWAQGSGTLITLFNRFRDSANNSFLLEDQGQPTFTASDAIIKNPTITGTGTIILDGRTFGTEKSGGGDSDAGEFILKADTQYAIRVTADIGSNGAHILLNWHEHTDE